MTGLSSSCSGSLGARFITKQARRWTWLGREMSERIERLVAGDRLIPLFGIEVEEASESLTRVSAVVKEEFLQVHDLAHGAFIFALLDVAFALTVNAKWTRWRCSGASASSARPSSGDKAHRRMPAAARRAAPDGGGSGGHRRRGQGHRQGTGDRHPGRRSRPARGAASCASGGSPPRRRRPGAREHARGLPDMRTFSDGQRGDRPTA